MPIARSHRLRTLADRLTNSQLQNSSVTVTAGTALSGGGAVLLGGSTTLNLANTTVTAWNLYARQRNGRRSRASHGCFLQRAGLGRDKWGFN